MRHFSKNIAHHMSVSLSDFYFGSIIAILGGFKGRLHASGAVVYLYAFNVKTINILFKFFLN